MKTRTPGFFASFLIAALAIVASAAHAGIVNGSGTLYGVRGHFGAGFAADLVEIDPVTGSLVQVIGGTGLDGVSGLAIHPTTGLLYAAVSGGGIGSLSPLALYVLDPSTGAATQVATATGLGVKDMAFNSAGTLYAVDSGNNLVTVELTAGAPTVIGALTTTFSGGMALAFDSADTLYVKDTLNLYTVDPATAAILSTQALTIPYEVDSSGLLRNSLALDENDVLYSIGWVGGIDSILVTIDPVTGVVTNLGDVIPPSGSNTLISAIDFARSSQNGEDRIPEPATLALLALGGLGLLRRRRRAA